MATSKKGSKAAQTKAAKAKAAKARKAAADKRAKEKEAERQVRIDSGSLIVNGDVEFHVVEDKKKAVVDERTARVVELLKKATKTPVLGKDIHANPEIGGAWPLLIPVFSTLKALGLVTEYRSRTGERGGSGVAYLWTE